MTLREIWTLLRETVAAWVDDYAPSMGAALAYYTIFSIAPVLLIVISVAGLVFGEDAARGEIFEQLRGLMGERGAGAVQEMLRSVNRPGEGLTAAVVGGVALLVGATTVFGELQASLDRIWQVRADQRPGGLWQLLRKRLLSFGLILGIGFLLIVSLVASAALAALSTWWSPYFGDWLKIAQLLNAVLSFTMIAVVFALIYKLMPSVRVAWRDVLIGAVVTALLFTIGKYLIGLYIGRSAVASAYGAAGSLVVLLLWVYYSAQIFLFGAEFTWVYAHRHGSFRKDAADAQPLPTAGAPSGEAEPAPSADVSAQTTIEAPAGARSADADPGASAGRRRLFGLRAAARRRR
ncbi:MAG: YihY/virulence factor BrkB family protein [Limnobacter sp.]|nr:YihY/virulence factor BrkB family protein [Limnobacter sp.]